MKTTPVRYAAVKGDVNALKLLIEVGHADISATDVVSHITVSYELFSLKYDILMWYSKLILTCLIPRLPIYFKYFDDIL